MKKLFTVLALIMAFATSATIVAQSNLSSKEVKAIEKASKKRSKELSKEGWKPLAATMPLEYMMIKYNTYIAENENDHKSLRGVALGKNNKIGRQNAINDAITGYAARAKAQVVGKMKSLVNADTQGESIQEIDKFGAAYESAVNAKLSGMVKEHFVLVKENPNGTKEYNAYLTIDEGQARKAREEAARLAEEKARVESLSEQVKEFIGEPVESED